MHAIATDDLFTELRRRIAVSAEPTRQEILDDVYALTIDHIADLPMGQLLELGSRCEEESERRFNTEAEAHAAPADN